MTSEFSGGSEVCAVPPLSPLCYFLETPRLHVRRDETMQGEWRRHVRWGMSKLLPVWFVRLRLVWSAHSCQTETVRAHHSVVHRPLLYLSILYIFAAGDQTRRYRAVSGALFPV